ncbi:hypothetical protein Taro_012485 [Colocasia esculenta]|uniref:Metallothionein-like protein n=1 Tax=Colocasia esculenta TaxID=4460 RepID=A0A843U962_COLES|nr:hypothetical protein [Colocasia esculenta]
MSCCGGNCGCGSGCKCGNGCGGCNMFPGLSSGETFTTETMLLGVAPAKGFLGASAAGSENDCKCGPSCSCVSCGCGCGK